MDWEQIWQWLLPGLIGLGTSNGGAWYIDEADEEGTPHGPGVDTSDPREGGR